MSSVPSRGELYDWEQAQVIGRTDQDLGFYRDLIAPGASVLELGCGTGRLTIPLADAGARIVGLDADPGMLVVARTRSAGVHLVRADARCFAFARAFDVVLAPYNFLQLLPDAEARTRCLATVTAHLAPGGVFAVEVRDFVAAGASAEVAPEPLHRGRLAEGEVSLHAGLRHDAHRRVTTYTRRFEITLADGTRRRVDDDVALYSFAPGELDALFTRAGLAAQCHVGGGVERWTARRIR